MRSTPATLLDFVANPPVKSPEPHDAAETSPYIIAAISEFTIPLSVKVNYAPQSLLAGQMIGPIHHRRVFQSHAGAVENRNIRIRLPAGYAACDHLTNVTGNRRFSTRVLE